MLQPNAILDDVQVLLHGPRLDDYGTQTLSRTAAMWSVYKGTHITPHDVCMMMVLLKVCREAHKAKRDNLVDVIGYAVLASQEIIP